MLCSVFAVLCSVFAVSLIPWDSIYLSQTVSSWFFLSLDALQCFAVSLQCLCSVFNTLGQYLLKSNSFILPFCSLCLLSMMFYKLYCPFLHLELFLKMGQIRPLLHLFSSFQSHITNFTKNRHVKNVHPVYGAGIQTHNLWNVSLLP